MTGSDSLELFNMKGFIEAAVSTTAAGIAIRKSVRPCPKIDERQHFSDKL